MDYGSKKIIKKYKLTNTSKILDVGCGKAFLLYEIKKILPNIKIVGIDISKHALKNAPDEIKPYLFKHDINKGLSFKKNSFNLVISLACLHNLKINKLIPTIKNSSFIEKQVLDGGKL